jgi:hypothetical protein
MAYSGGHPSAYTVPSGLSGGCLYASNRSGSQNFGLVITTADGVLCHYAYASRITTGTLGTDPL